MNSKNIFLSLVAIVSLLFSACSGEAPKTTKPTSVPSDAKIEVIQFHSEHRCESCLKIEEMSKEVVKDYPDIQFSLVNVDDEKNEEKAEEFEAAGTALFLYNPKIGKKKDLTDFAFMNAENKEKFIEGLKKEISEFEE